MVLHGWIRHLFSTENPGRRSALPSWQRSEPLERRALLAAFVVTTPADLPDDNAGDGIAVAANGQTSLRAALEEANSQPGTDTIVLPPGLFELRDGITSETSAVASSQLDPLTVTDSVRLAGAGSAATQIDGGTLAAVFDVRNGASLSLGWLAVRSTSHRAVTVTSGKLIEVADVDRDSEDEFAGLPVADLEIGRGLVATILAANERQKRLLAPGFRRDAPAPSASPLLIPSRPRDPQQQRPLDATVGITSPGADDAPAVSRLGDDGSHSENLPMKVINSLFETSPVENDGGVLPAAANDSIQSSGAAEDQDSSEARESQPLLLDDEPPQIETELPVIDGAAPLLPDLEFELPDIQIEHPTATPRRGTFLPVTLGGLLAATFQWRSSKNRKHNSQHSPAGTQWATRVEALT